MNRSLQEEEEVRTWLETQDVRTLAESLRINPQRLYYFKDGKAKNPSYQLIRELILIKERRSKQ